MDYPKRTRSHYAHRYTRLLTKTCAVHELGHTAAWLCVVIAHQEDAKRYKGPVTFYNEQLMALVGVKKWEALDLARKKAMDSGWLHYENRGKRLPGFYWVTVPGELEELSDDPCDESPELSTAKGDNAGETLSPPLYPQKGDRGGYREGDRGGYREGDRGGYREGYRGGDPPIPTPDPIPDPRPHTAEAEEEPDKLAKEAADALLLEAQRIWNAAKPLAGLPGLLNWRDITSKRRTAWKARMASPQWRAMWRDALRRVTSLRFCHGGGDRRWQADVDWFLRPDTVTHVLEGKYDDRTTIHDPRRNNSAANNFLAGLGLAPDGSPVDACDPDHGGRIPDFGNGADIRCLPGGPPRPGD